MNVAIVCTGLLALLLFGLGFSVSMKRGRSEGAGGYPQDQADPMFKRIRAHANTAEYASMFAVLFLFLGAQNPSAWITWTIVIATVCRYLIAAGILVSPTLAKPHPLRFIGALGTYITGIVLALAALSYA
jgi:hypothetical protein